MSLPKLLTTALVVALAGCGTQPITPSSGHLRQEARPSQLPPPVTTPVALPRPQANPRQDTYTVVVHDAPLRDVLFALARDARLNIDIHPRLAGDTHITLNAINQTVLQILERISRQADIRYEFFQGNLQILPDEAYLKTYTVDYLNMTRDMTSTVSIATQIANTGTVGVNSSGSSSSSAGNNNSTTSITNTANHNLWRNLVENVAGILGVQAANAQNNTRTTTLCVASSDSTATNNAPTASTTAAASPLPSNKDQATPNTAQTASGQNTPNGSSTPLPAVLNSTQQNASNNAAGGASRSSSNSTGNASQAECVVLASPETSLLTIKATARQHRQVQDFLDQFLASAKRQVLIEATVAEVQLNNEYQQGINWSRLRSDGLGGLRLVQTPNGPSNLGAGGAPGTSPETAISNIFTLAYSNTSSKIGNFNLTLSLLEAFGKVKVLSSPKISVLNNQTALLKVVDNKVYFTSKVTITRNTDGNVTDRLYETTINTVPIGFVMSVTPQIDAIGSVSLNVRPTISRIIRYVNDPNPALAAASISNPIPEIQTREMESVIRVHSGQIAVMGGLMQDTMDNRTDAVPGLSQLPWVGDAFKYRSDATTKTELVVFLRPIIVKAGTLQDDYPEFSNFLPDNNFFKNSPAATSEEKR